MDVDIAKLKLLTNKVSDAMFELHDYLRNCGDGFWQDVYRRRVELGHVMYCRARYWQAMQAPKERKQNV